MEFQGYEFEEEYLPLGFESDIRSIVNFNLAFYIKKKYIPDENDWMFDNKYDDGEDVVAFCPTFNEVFDIDKKIVENHAGGCGHGVWSYHDPVCPNEGDCGATCYLKNAAYKNNNISRKYKFGFIQQTNRGVVVRVFECVFDFSGDKYELQRTGYMRTNEAMRIFFNTDRTTEIYSRFNKSYSGYAGYFISVGGNWKKKKKYQSYADFVLLDDFKGTLLEGFSKYIELSKTFVIDSAMGMVLLLALFNVPALKYVIKAGFLNMAESIVNWFIDTSTGRLQVNKKAKNIKELFGFDISKLNHLSESLKNSLSSEDIPGLRELSRLGLEFNDVNCIMAKSENFRYLLNELDDEEAKQTLKYLRAQREVKSDNKIGDYYDYFKQCITLDLDLNNKEIRFPKSLHRAHARLSTLIKYSETDALRELFHKQAVRYEKFCFRQKNLSLRAIRTVEELKLWALRFSNCSGGYADRIAKGQAMIFVIVDRNSPKEPYFMVEYNTATKKIVQCRGYDNLTNMNDDAAVKDFCTKWQGFIKGKKPAKLVKAKPIAA